MSNVKLVHSTGNGTIIAAPAANPSSNITLKVPSTTGTAGQALKVASANHSSTNAELEWGGIGKVLQVVSTTRTDTFSEASIDEGDHSGAAISVSITPTAASSKVFVIASLNIGLDTDNEISFAFFRGGSILTGIIGDAAGSRTRTSFGGKCESSSATENLSGFYLDSPSTTSATTYDCRLSHGHNGGNRTMYLNRSHSDTDADQDSRFASTITVVEIGA
tara:strand:+ start:306 stop:965 length:660 start_codon:yes stop_codon:yes gene_type:complete